MYKKIATLAALSAFGFVLTTQCSFFENIGTAVNDAVQGAVATGETAVNTATTTASDVLTPGAGQPMYGEEVYVQEPVYTEQPMSGTEMSTAELEQMMDTKEPMRMQEGEYPTAEEIMYVEEMPDKTSPGKEMEMEEIVFAEKPETMKSSMAQEGTSGMAEEHKMGMMDEDTIVQ